MTYLKTLNRSAAGVVYFLLKTLERQENAGSRSGTQNPRWKCFHVAKVRIG